MIFPDFSCHLDSNKANEVMTMDGYVITSHDMAPSDSEGQSQNQSFKLCREDFILCMRKLSDHMHFVFSSFSND